MANNSLRDSLLANAPVEPAQSNFLYSAEMLEDLDGGAPIVPLATGLVSDHIPTAAVATPSAPQLLPTVVPQPQTPSAPLQPEHMEGSAPQPLADIPDLPSTSTSTSLPQQDSMITFNEPNSDVADALPQDWPRTGADDKTLLLYESLDVDNTCCGSQATAELKEHVVREAQRLSALTTTNRREMQGFMSNDELLRGLTFHWERPQAIFLDYDRLSIYLVNKDGETQPQENDHLPGGRLLLTDKRLLFLSNQRDKKSLLSEHVTKSGRSSTQFTLKSHDRETQLYYPIPLSKVQSINFRFVSPSSF